MHVNDIKEEGIGGRYLIGLCEHDKDSRDDGRDGREVN
jgi:hypothetical protein